MSYRKWLKKLLRVVSSNLRKWCTENTKFFFRNYKVSLTIKSSRYQEIYLKNTYRIIKRIIERILKLCRLSKNYLESIPSRSLLPSRGWAEKIKQLHFLTVNLIRWKYIMLIFFYRKWFKKASRVVSKYTPN